MSLKLNAYQLAQEIRDGNISAEDHMARLLEHIEKTDKKINAFITINERAIDEARKVDKERKGRLAGVPLAVKDNICTKGIRTTCASKMLENFIPPYDATVIARLKKEGAIIIGKTNMDEFGMGSSTEFSIIGPSRNPWDQSRVTGGSSGGSAASVVAYESCIALGSDTGGSIRCPASFCSCVGLKPTYGLVSRYGLVSYANSMEIIGPLTRSVYDAALMLQTIAGIDEYDNTTHTSKDYMQFKDVKGIKIALVKEMIEGADEDIVKSIYSSLDKLSTLEIKIDEISLPSLKYALAAYYTTAMAEASSNLARYDGIRYGKSIEPEGIEWNRYYMMIRSNFGDEVKRRIILGTYVLSSGYYGKYYLKAQKVRSMIRRELLMKFKDYNILVAPTMPILPFKIGERINDPIKLYLSDIDTVLANITGIPALSMPSSFKDGLPIGIQFMAKHDEEGLLLSIGKAFEDINDIRGEPKV
ncbi:MAG: Asp-tRNA(Asn)/Glu-tRNA(Gln) amidotransferase subunit GatA [Candidatus Nitrosothermus koennekii]|nr:MAG: Asp-tRNA(Asn)/Glu-tRNA(Gln) amidotransferase subunit GatA [Candidatus Nitrosothermus koennekii]